MNIVDLDAQRPHYSGPALCRSNPEHRWRAIVPVAGNPFAIECPYCNQPGVMAGYLIAAGLDPADVQCEYEKMIRSLNMGNALLLTALHQATDGEQGADCVVIEKAGSLQ